MRGLRRLHSPNSAGEEMRCACSASASTAWELLDGSMQLSLPWSPPEAAGGEGKSLTTHYCMAGPFGADSRPGFLKMVQQLLQETIRKVLHIGAHKDMLHSGPRLWSLRCAAAGGRGRHSGSPGAGRGWAHGPPPAARSKASWRGLRRTCWPAWAASACASGPACSKSGASQQGTRHHIKCFPQNSRERLREALSEASWTPCPTLPKGLLSIRERPGATCEVPSAPGF